LLRLLLVMEQVSFSPSANVVCNSILSLVFSFRFSRKTTSL